MNKNVSFSSSLDSAFNYETQTIKELTKMLKHNVYINRTQEDAMKHNYEKVYKTFSTHKHAWVHHHAL